MRKLLFFGILLTGILAICSAGNAQTFDMDPMIDWSSDGSRGSQTFYDKEGVYIIEIDQRDLGGSYFSGYDGVTIRKRGQLLPVARQNVADGKIRFFLEDISDIEIGGDSLYTNSSAGVNSPASAPNWLQHLLMRRIVLPSVKPLETAGPGRGTGAPKILVSEFAFQRIDYGRTNDQGDILTGTVGMGWDIDEFSFGYFLVYDYMDYETFDGDR
ncbi:MAG: hypothetical protein GY868_01255, partial [Deltaproteobacteria bacterium]|nr:hypothetical protein [Deltaproteobacteria bacterium]